MRPALRYDPSSRADIQVTNRLRRLSAEMELPLIEHVVVAGAGVRGRDGCVRNEEKQVAPLGATCPLVGSKLSAR